MSRQRSRDPEVVTRAMELAAIEAAGSPDGWMPYRYSLMAAGGIRVTGCHTRPKTSGPNKGSLLYLTKVNRKVVVIHRDDVDRHIAAAARELAGSAVDEPGKDLFERGRDGCR